MVLFAVIHSNHRGNDREGRQAGVPRSGIKHWMVVM